MKKSLLLILTLVLAIFVMASCGGDSIPTPFVLRTFPPDRGNRPPQGGSQERTPIASPLAGEVPNEVRRRG